MSSLQASPMQLQYSITWEQYLTQDVVDEMVRQEANGRTHNCSCVKKKFVYFKNLSTTTSKAYPAVHLCDEISNTESRVRVEKTCITTCVDFIGFSSFKLHSL